MTDQSINMQGKVCLVTGATSGIGLVTARELARMGATVILHGRNPKKGEAALAHIRSTLPNAHIDLLLADLSVQAQVRQLSSEFKDRYDQLHALVNNAGAAFARRQLTADGIEMTFATNHLSYFLLTDLLLDTLKASAPARVVNVSSNAHFGKRIDFEDLQNQRAYNVLDAYGQSKLANILFTYELARRLEGTGVTANALHPGLVRTNIGANNGCLVNLFVRLFFSFGVSPQDGAQTSIFLASSPLVEGLSGQYYIDSRPARSSSASYDLAAAQRLWQASQQLTVS